MKVLFNFIFYAICPSILFAFIPYRKNEIRYTDISLDKYLRRYGYLTDQAVGSALVASTDARTAGIRFFQRFNHLPVTGELDNATLSLMNTPRCGCPDVISLKESKSPYSFALGTKWRRSTDLTWKIITPTNQVSLSAQRAEFTRAFKVWSDVAKLTFTETTGTANINILFATGDHGNGDPYEEPFDGPGNVLAHAFFPEDGRTHFDETETWVISSNQGIDLFTVAAHEIGHAIGLDHSEVQSALMAPFYTGYNPNFQLDSDDIAGARALYGAAVVATSTLASTSVSSAATISSATTTPLSTTAATTPTTVTTAATTTPTTVTTAATTSPTVTTAVTTPTTSQTTSKEPESTSTNQPTTASSSVIVATNVPPTSQTDKVVMTTTSGSESCTFQKNITFTKMVLSLSIYLFLFQVL